MQFDPFDPLGLWPEHEAKERQRRALIGKFGRLKEDAPSLIGIAAILAIYVIVIAGPYLVGLYAISTWLLRRYLP